MQDWAAQDVSYRDKVELYFRNVATAEHMVDNLEFLNVTGFLLSFLCLWRLIAYLAIHPRIGILPGIFVNAAHHLTSFMKYSMLIFVVTAVLARNQFGPNNEAYGTFSQTCMTQFNLVMGETEDFFSIQQTARSSLAVAIYIFAYIGLVVFMLTNLFLSIIVESYMKTKDDLAAISNNCSKSIASDIFEVCYMQAYGARNGWPTHSQIVQALEVMDGDGDGLITEDEFKAALAAAGNDESNVFEFYYKHSFLRPAQADIVEASKNVISSSDDDGSDKIQSNKTDEESCICPKPQVPKPLPSTNPDEGSPPTVVMNS